MWNLKNTNSGLPWAGGWGNGEIFVKEYKLPVTRLTKSGDLMYSMVIIVNNTVLHT